jgi:hypothetical protein
MPTKTARHKISRSFTNQTTNNEPALPTRQPTMNQLYQPDNQQWTSFINQTTNNEQTLPTKQPTITNFTNQTTNNEPALPTKQPTMNQLYQPNNQQWTNFTNQTTNNEPALPTKQPTMNQIYQPNHQQWTGFTIQTTNNEPALLIKQLAANQLYQSNNQQLISFTNQTTKNEPALPTKQRTINSQQWISFTNQSTNNETALPTKQPTINQLLVSSHCVQFNLSEVDWTATGILHYKHAFSSRCWVRAQWDHIPDRSHGNNPEVLPWEGKKWDWEAVIKQGVVRFVFQPPCTSFHPRPCNHFAPPGKENFLAGSESKWTDARKTETSVAEKEKWCKNGGLSAVISEARGLPKFFYCFRVACRH